MTRNVFQALADDRGEGSTQMHYHFLPTRSSSSLPDTTRPPTPIQVPHPISTIDHHTEHFAVLWRPFARLILIAVRTGC